MSEHDFADLARRARDQVEVSPPPYDAIDDASAGRRRPRAAWVIGAAAASVLVVAGGIAVVSSVGPTAGPPAAPSATVSSLDPLPAPPRGSRWFAYNDVMVAIPQEWAQTERGCTADTPGAVVENVAAWRSDCQSLTLADRPFVHLAATDRDRRPTPRVGVVPVPSTEVSIVVEGPPSVVRSVVDSAAPVPPGYHVAGRGPGFGTIPRGGFSPATTTVEEIRSPFTAGTYLGSDPVVGTPVPAGSEVTVLVSSGLGEPAISEARLRTNGYELVPADGTPSYTRAMLDDELRPREDGKILQVYLRRSLTDIGGDDVAGNLVWVVMYPDTRSFLSGPCCDPHPGTYAADGMAVYDGTTGRQLVFQVGF